jgi:hypothetical protein
MKKGLFILLIICAFASNSCKKQLVQETFEKNLAEFDSLVLNSVFEVHLIQGTENKIKIDGAKKILEKITISIENNTLKLENKYNGNWMRPEKNKVVVFITVNKLAKITANETCNILTDNTLVGDEIGLVLTSKLNQATLDLQCETFYFWNNFPCGGKVTLTGNTNFLKIWNVALMAVDASKLLTNNALIENSSKGDCKVFSTQSLTYKLSGEGNLYVKGNPVEIIKLEESSTGTLILE